MSPPRRTSGSLAPWRLFDASAFHDSGEAVDFIGNVLEASTEYSMIGTSLDGTILLWNEGARRMYGYEPEEVVGKVNSSILHAPEDVASGRPAEILAAALARGKWEGTITRLRKDGSRCTARVVTTPRQDATGRPVGFLLISRDVTEEMRLIEQLEATQSYTRSLIETSIDALAATDEAGTITDVNERMEELTGIGRTELIGTPLKRCFTDPEGAEEGIRRVLRQGRVTDYELTAWSRCGRRTVVSCNAATFFDREGRLLGVLATARDVTERRHVEVALLERNAELEQANRAKDRFLASMSHELRTPLNAIIGFTGTLLMGLPGPLNEEQARQLGTVQGSGRHLLAIINDLLDLAKVESGTSELEIGVVDCRALVEEVAGGLEPLATSKGLACSRHQPATSALVRTDRRLLSQVLINLLGNAIKFTERGRVGVELGQVTSRGSTITTFRVTDSGPGISAENMGRLFQAFQQLDGGGGRSTEGSGLGLYISQRLAALLDGEITVESEPGRGSTFILTLREALPG